jgi:urease accessory protein
MRRSARAPTGHPEELRRRSRDEGSLRLLPVAGLAAGVLLLPKPAHAHLVTTGLGPLYDGISHLFLSFEDLLPVVALALLSGLNGPRTGRLALFVVPAAWLAGGLAGFAAGTPLFPGTVTAASFLVLGGLTAADRQLPPAAVTVLAAALGLLHGWLNGAGIAEAGREALGLVGIVSAVFVVVALLAAFVVWLRPPWARIAVRVAGSWIAAIGLLLLGWGLRPTP